VADSEGSSIRAVPFDPAKEVRTVVGTADLPFARLFEFGDVDGPKDKARLQHALGIVHEAGRLYVADTYNNKIKVVNAQTGETRTLAGTGQPGYDDVTGQFDEPAGITFAQGKLYVADTNNHVIRTVDPTNGKTGTLQITGLAPPSPPKTAKKPSFAGATQVELEPSVVRAVDGRVTLTVQLKLPDGWKINPLAPMAYLLEAVGESGAGDRAQLRGELTRLATPADRFDIAVPIATNGDAVVRVSLNYYYCQDEGAGLCKAGSVVWTVPLKIAPDAEATAIPLRLTVQP
jgi:hypothetical protein